MVVDAHQQPTKAATRPCLAPGTGAPAHTGIPSMQARRLRCRRGQRGARSASPQAPPTASPTRQRRGLREPTSPLRGPICGQQAGKLKRSASCLQQCISAAAKSRDRGYRSRGVPAPKRVPIHAHALNRDASSKGRSAAGVQSQLSSLTHIQTGRRAGAGRAWRPGCRTTVWRKTPPAPPRSGSQPSRSALHEQNRPDALAGTSACDASRSACGMSSSTAGFGSRCGYQPVPVAWSLCLLRHPGCRTGPGAPLPCRAGTSVE